MPPKPKLNPSKFPRPPALEKVSRHLRIEWNGSVFADTKEGYWALETHHPPTYYFPPSSISPAFKLNKSPHSSICEWKGRATYWDVSPATPEGGEKVRNRIWSYDDPTPSFKPIAGYLSFYVGPWRAFVDGEEVKPQDGQFYGGWLTDEIEGPTKGGPGTLGW